MTQEQIHTAAEEYAVSIAQSDERKRYCAEDFAAGGPSGESTPFGMITT